MEHLKGGIYISPKDIQIINNCNIHEARKEHRTIRDVLNVLPKKLTVKAYCEYIGVEYDLVVSYINPFR